MKYRTLQKPLLAGSIIIIIEYGEGNNMLINYNN